MPKSCKVLRSEAGQFSLLSTLDSFLPYRYLTGFSQNTFSYLTVTLQVQKGTGVLTLQYLTGLQRYLTGFYSASGRSRNLTYLTGFYIYPPTFFGGKFACAMELPVGAGAGQTATIHLSL